MWQNALSPLATIVFGTMPYAASSIGIGRCTRNGIEIPCEELIRSIDSLGIIGIVFVSIFFIVILWAIIFWIKMLLDSIRRDIESKPMWILLILLAGFLGALIYYFAIKKKAAYKPTVPPLRPA